MEARMRKPWTESEVEILKLLYPDNRCSDIADAMNCGLKRIYGKAKALGLKKSEAFNQSTLSGRITNMMLKGADFRFKKGHQPYNKGLSWNDFMSPENQLKSLRAAYHKGHLPHNTKSDGEISIRRDKNSYDYKFKRIHLGDWKALHVCNWEEMYGPVPEGFIVVFRSADRMNCDISNLELITREENMLRNSIQRYPKELQDVMKLQKQLTHQINGKK
jgi:hypothetical protein